MLINSFIVPVSSRWLDLCVSRVLTYHTVASQFSAQRSALLVPFLSRSRPQPRNDREAQRPRNLNWLSSPTVLFPWKQNFCVGSVGKTCGCSIRNPGGRGRGRRLYTLESKKVLSVLEENHYLAHCKLIAFVQSVWKWMQTGWAMKHPTVKSQNKATCTGDMA